MYTSGLVTQVIQAKNRMQYLEMVIEKGRRIVTFNGESSKMVKLQFRPILLANQMEARVSEGDDLVVKLNSDNTKAMMEQFTHNAWKSKL
jgi:hypothetical protein